MARNEEERGARKQGGTEQRKPVSILTDLRSAAEAVEKTPGQKRILGHRIGTSIVFAAFDTSVLWPLLMSKVEADKMYLGTALQFRDDMADIGGARVAVSNRGEGVLVSLYVARPARRAMGLQVALGWTGDGEFKGCSASGLLMNSLPIRPADPGIIPEADQVPLAAMYDREVINGGDVSPAFAQLLGVIATTTDTLTRIAQHQNPVVS